MVFEKVIDYTRYDINYSFIELLINYGSLIARYSHCTTVTVTIRQIPLNLRTIFNQLVITNNL